MSYIAICLFLVFIGERKISMLSNCEVLITSGNCSIFQYVNRTPAGVVRTVPPTRSRRFLYVHIYKFNKNMCTYSFKMSIEIYVHICYNSIKVRDSKTKSPYGKEIKKMVVALIVTVFGFCVATNLHNIITANNDKHD